MAEEQEVVVDVIKLSLAGLANLLSVIFVYGQNVKPDSIPYESRRLKLEEVNFVSSYYTQNGNHSAVTGGIGSELLSDVSSILEVRLIKPDNKNRLHLASLQLGVDAYTSASSDKIDPATVSSASKSDKRIYPSVTYLIKNNIKRRSLGIIGYFSTEYDYTSFSGGVNFTKASEDNNKEFTFKFQAFFDKWLIILPIELRYNPEDQINNSNRNSYNASFIYSAIINKRTNFALITDLALQNGLLSTPFHRVYFSNDEVRVEKLPDTRFKVPIGARLNYFLGDRIVLRTFYRFYYDTWNLWANTFSIEAPVKITPFLSLGPVYRFYTQTGIDYFAPFKVHSPSDEFYTSDYDLSKFDSHLIGLNFRKISAEGILGIKKLNVLEMRYSYYYRTTNLSAHTIALSLKFK
ncbi:MAG: DUF3570 domain-containing protein [Sporocytophaga sp.]|uniref:DUF3570 domain-containing protein n=1 Tax=Sporocytophaga sp. TaxID=2231183 RepID=UPI001B00C635|nr:DUF3570 domain-containing protein [Sporocytophaga sp.]MBO9699079.1 DUF3570 domain-containing protein [Sporocytophaga sp.]